MGIKRLFLKMPINLQIQIFIKLLLFTCFLFIIIISESIFFVYNEYLIGTKKKYFFNLEKRIIESNIYFQNVCLYQYENLIKLFNYQFYLYLENENILLYFANNSNYLNNYNNTVLFSHEIDKRIPEYDPSIPYEDQKIYVYCYSKHSLVCQNIYKLIYINSMPFLNQVKAIRNFRIPFYGDFPIFGEYIVALTKYDTLYSFNITRIREMIVKAKDKIKETIDERSVITYNFFKKFFYDFENNKFYFFEIMYKKRYDIFFNFSKIKDINEKEEYIKKQSIYFQTIHFENDTTRFYNNWDYRYSRYTCKNSIINGYFDFLIPLLSTTLNIISIPISHETNNLISNNLCYYLLIKQIIILNITSEQKISEFNEKFLIKIKNIIFNKTIINIDDCKIKTYLQNNNIKEKKKAENFKFFNYYDLEYKLFSLFFSLREKDENTNIFEMKFSFPNFNSLKESNPNFFSFQQLDFYSFSFENSLIKKIKASKEFLNNINFLMLLTLNFLWILILIIFDIILSRTIIQILQPINNLIEAIELNNIIKKKEILFEYKLDENINKFFLLCNNLFEGKIKEKSNLLKFNSNEENYSYNNNNNINNNLIINNRMIIKLNEEKNICNNNDNEIFLLRYNNYIDLIKPRKKNIKKLSSTNHKDNSSKKIANIFLKKVCNNDDEDYESNSNSTKGNNLNNNEIDNDINNNIALYKDFLDITHFLFDKYDKSRIKKNDDKSDNKNHSQLEINTYISFIDNENIFYKKKDYKYIAYYWYMNAKQNNHFIINYDIDIVSK